MLALVIQHTNSIFSAPDVLSPAALLAVPYCKFYLEHF